MILVCLCICVPSGAPGILSVCLLLGDDASLPAALGSLQTQDLSAGPSPQGGSQTGPSHLHQELPAPGLQRLHPLDLENSVKIEMFAEEQRIIVTGSRIYSLV